MQIMQIQFEKIYIFNSIARIFFLSTPLLHQPAPYPTLKNHGFNTKLNSPKTVQIYYYMSFELKKNICIHTYEYDTLCFITTWKMQQENRNNYGTTNHKPY